MGISYDMWAEEDASIWLLNKLSYECYDKLNIIAMTLWGIWFFRNKVWENKEVMPKFAMEWSLKQLSDWRSANNKIAKVKTPSMVHNQQSNAKWVALVPGSFKLNVDASIVEGSSSFSIGMVLRNHRGQFVGGKVMRFEKKVTVFEAEA